MTKKDLKPIPKFDSEDDEREFWAIHELSDYFSFSKEGRMTEPGAFPNLKRTEGLIQLHIDDASARQLKTLAKERKVDLAVLAAEYVREGIQRDARYLAR
ncbi:MAG TPA: CopG family antitoxin [Candidatus Kapabacteria bacterium]|jgi:hypothetical protein